MSTRKRSRASAATADEPFAGTNSGGDDASMNEMPLRKKSRKEDKKALAKRLAQQELDRKPAPASPSQPAAAVPLSPAAAAVATSRRSATAQRLAEKELASKAASSPATQPAATASPPVSVAAVATTSSSATKNRASSSTTRPSSRSLAAQKILAGATASQSPVAPTAAAAATPPRPAVTVPKTSFQSPAKPAAVWRPSLPPAAAAPPTASSSQSKTVAAPTRAAVAAASAPVRPAATVASPVVYRHNGSSNSNNHATRSPRAADSDDDDDEALQHQPYGRTPKDDSPRASDEKVDYDGSSDDVNGFVDTDQGLTESTKMLGRIGKYAILIATVMILVTVIGVVLTPPSQEGPTLLQLTSSSTTGSPTTEAQKSTLAPDSRPCFETYPPRLREDDPQDASAVLEYWAPHCSREYYLQEPFASCPPHAVCKGGKIVACDSYFWVPKQRTPLVSAATSKEPGTNDDVDWPTECVLSEQAEVFLSSVTNILEGWYVSSSCSSKASSKPPVMRSADGTMYPLVSYNDVLSELEQQGHDQQLQDMLFPDADLFQELAEGRLAMSSTTDEATSTSTLWIGLLPKHMDPRPRSCQIARGIVVHLVGNFLLGSLRSVITVLLLPIVSFVWNVLVNVFWLSPMVSTVAILLAVFYTGYMRPRQARRRAEQQLVEQLDSIQRAAMHLLQKESEALPVLALREAIRDQQQRKGPGMTSSIAYFNEVVWPEVQARLEADQRIGVVVRDNQRSMKWHGPKSS